MTTLRVRAAGLAALLLAAGCRNPFDPTIDLRIDQVIGGTTGQNVERLQQINTATYSTISTQFVFANYNAVAAVITSYTVVYKQVGAQNDPACIQPPGQPICALGGAAGRRAAILLHIPAKITNDTTVTFTYFARILTPEVFHYISTHNDTTNGGLDCEVTFFGSDDNGHDFTRTATIHVEVYP